MDQFSKTKTLGGGLKHVLAAARSDAALWILHGVLLLLLVLLLLFLLLLLLLVGDFAVEHLCGLSTLQLLTAFGSCLIHVLPRI